MKDNSNKIIKWGIIGLGKIANKFAADLLTIENAELFAVASRSPKNATEFANKYNAKKAYNSYEELAKNEEIDAIYIATPHSFHKEHTLLCLQNKKAVLCEKPFAMNLEEGLQMIAMAKQENVLLMEALWTYFLPHYQFVLELVASKKYGEITHLKADFGFTTDFNEDSRVLKKELGGGSLLDIGMYPVFAALSLLGNPMHKKATATFFKNGADASCSIKFIYKNATADLQSTLVAETPTEAIITLENATITLHTRFHEPTSVTVKTTTATESFNFETIGIGYRYEIIHFNNLLRLDKKESDIMTFKRSKNLLKTLDEIRNLIGLQYS